MTKILTVGDPHCFYDNYSHQTADGISSRLADWKQTAGAIVELARLAKVDLIVVPGDLYPNARPSSQAQIALLSFFSALEAVAPVIACNGNHDVAGPGQPGPVDLLAAMGRPRWGITKPTIVDVAGIQVAVIPWAKPASLLQEAEGAGDLAARTSAALVSITWGLAAQLDPAKPAILIGHWAIGGCQTSSGMTISGGEPALPLGDLQAGPWRAVIMGHIHKPQVFPGAPVVLHTGAMERVDFGEQDDRRGCYIIDTDTGLATWHDLEVRRFWTWWLTPSDLDELSMGRHPADILLEGGQAQKAEDAICRVRFKATEAQQKVVDQALLRQVLETAGAYHFAGVFPETIRSERSRAEGLTEATSPLEALDTWLGMRSDLTLETKSAARAAAEQILQEVATGGTH